jgi:hypothetical protein
MTKMVERREEKGKENEKREEKGNTDHKPLQGRDRQMAAMVA